VSRAPGFEELAGRIAPADVSSLLALRALVAHADGSGAVGRATWMTALQEEYRQWYHGNGAAAASASGQVANFPDADTLRYLDEHIVRHLHAGGVLHTVDVDASGPWEAVQLTPWAAEEALRDRVGALEVLDRRIRSILRRPEPAPAPTPPAAVAEPAVVTAEGPAENGFGGEGGFGEGAGADVAVAPAAEPPAVEAEPEPEVPERRGPIEGGSTLSARGLVKTYRKRKVVNEVDLHVAQGEIVGLLGPNGAGKTTSFYMMVGLIAPDKGTVALDKRDLTGVPMFKRARAGIGYLAQEPSIFRRLTVEENILAVLQMMGIPRKEQRRRLETLLDELSIKHLRRSFAYALSGGERRRLEITRALVGEPKFMLLDEPFAGVDPIAVHDIQQIVADLRKRGIGVLISDHNVEQTLDIVDRAYIMYDGRVRVSGTVSELVWNDEVAEIYLGPTLTARMRERYSSPDKESAA
jgi:lipopolysaccharide export system ATP-binding protein